MLFGANVEPRHKIGRSFFLEIAIDTIQWKRTACEIFVTIPKDKARAA